MIDIPTCTICGRNPRLGSLARCRACLRAAAEQDRQAAAAARGRPLETKSRPRGSGYQRIDSALAEEMFALTQAGAVSTWHEAAAAVAGRAHGRGTIESRQRRLARLAQALFGDVSPKRQQNSINLHGRRTPESDSVPAMIARNEHEMVVAELEKTRRAERALRRRNNTLERSLTAAHEHLDLAHRVLDQVLPDQEARMSEIERELREQQFGPSPSPGVH